MRNYPGEYTFKSCEIAVSSCTGGKGFDSNTLFGAPSIDESSVLPPRPSTSEATDGEQDRHESSSNYQGTAIASVVTVAVEKTDAIAFTLNK